MKLIGAGLPRTATLTQRAALEILGLAPCYHMQNVFADLSEVERWRAALDGKVAAADILQRYPAMVDWPGSYYYRELMDAHPDAKVLLSVRDGMSWAKSMQQTIWGLLYGDTLMRHLSEARMKVDPVWATYIEMMKEMWQRMELLDGEATTLEFMAAAMERFNERVRRSVPPERLLEWSPKDGWKPLCAFLDLPIPDEPVPHINDTRQFIGGLEQACLAAVSEHLLVNA